MWVELDFTGPASEPQLVVPSEAVIVTGERSVVIIASDKGSFDVVSVSTGVEQDGRTPILSGLKQGQLIVLSGQFLIDSEAVSYTHLDVYKRQRKQSIRHCRRLRK